MHLVGLFYYVTNSYSVKSAGEYYAKRIMRLKQKKTWHDDWLGMDESLRPMMVLNYKPEEHRGAKGCKKNWKDEFN
jgi:Uri superfamily endonuclease